MTCEKCGATLGPQIPKCPYCNTTTAFGVAQQAADAQRAAQQAQYQAAAQYQAEQYNRARASQEVYSAGVELQRTADQAFLWSLAGLFLCCIPVLPIVGIVMGFRARGVAQSRNIVVPGKATAAIVMGFSSFVVLIGAIAFSQYLQAKKADQVAALEKVVGKHAGDAALSVAVACKLSELYLIDNEFQGSHFDDGEVNCDGSKWSANGDRAELTGTRIRMYSSSKPVEANVCFRRGEKWVVDAVVTTSCDDYLKQKAAGSTSASTTESAPNRVIPPDPVTPPASPPTPNKTPLRPTRR